MNRHVPLLLFLSFVAMLPRAIEARVYYRWGGENVQWMSTEHSGWKQAGEKRLLINGRPHHLQIFAARGTAQSALLRLRDLYTARGAVVAVFPGHDLSWGVAAWPDRNTRWLILSSRALPQPLAFLVHDESSTPAPAQAPPLPGIPDFPGAVPGTTLIEPDKGIATRFLSTSVAPADILSFYENAMRLEGWMPFFDDGTGRAASAPLAVYIKDGRFCFISVSSSSPFTKNIITLLTKD